MAAVRAVQAAQQRERGIILCGREYLNSLEDSVMEEIKAAIEAHPFLTPWFRVGSKFVETVCGRVKFAFTGLRQNINSVKGKSRIILALLDEAEDISQYSYDKLDPTIREEGSELWAIWNPEKKGSATDKMFRQHPPERSIIVNVNWRDNPWFSSTANEKRLHAQRVWDPARYNWIYEGHYRENSDAQIFANRFRVAEFTPGPDWDGPYYGLDFGFSKDPTAAVKLWINDNRLFYEYSAGKVGLDLDETAPYLMKRIPGIERGVVRADSSRPESISFLKRHGLPKIVGAVKGKGSVEDGIAHMKSYREIVIHPRCGPVIEEHKLYSFKVDRQSEEVTDIIIDEHNHYIDAGRYALEPVMRQKARPSIRRL